MNLIYTYAAASKKYKPMKVYDFDTLKAELSDELIKEWFVPIGTTWKEIEVKLKPVVKKEKVIAEVTE